MQFIEDFKQGVGKWIFQRDLKKNTRTKEACNINDAESIRIRLKSGVDTRDDGK